MKVLIVEDERILSQSIKDYLERDSYLCEQAFNYDDAMMMVNVYDYDCILLDLMLNGHNGLDILRAIRKRHNPVGVIIISAKDALDDRIAGLEIGADDYLAKPFALPELSMRIYALIRRREFGADNVISSDNVRVNLLDKSVSVMGQPITLTHTEYELLTFFLGNRGHVLSKAAIAEHLSGEMADMMDSFDFIYSHIKNLKSKLAKAGLKDSIKTIYATGYKWVD